MSAYTENVDKATQAFRKLILASYELDDSFVDSLCDFYVNTVKELLASLPAPKAARGRATTTVASTAAATTAAPLVGEGAEAPKKEKAAKGSRKKSSYNIFVREMMKSAEIQSLDHKQKMGAIAGKWKSLDDAARADYDRMANEENETGKSEELTLAESA
jgi:hypothetical protein